MARRLPAALAHLAAGGAKNGRWKPQEAAKRPDGLPAQSEADWQRQVLAYARLRGWRWWHDRATNTPSRCGGCGAYRRIPRNDAGWPDLVLVRRPDLLFAELKRDGEHPTPDQQAWIDELRACGLRVFVWRPADWIEVQEVLR